MAAMKRGRCKAVIALCSACIVVLGFFGCASFPKEKEERREMGEAERTKQFLMEHMLESGGVRTNFLDSTVQREFATGSDVLSESQGLLMQYAVETDDEELFAEAYAYVREKLLIDDTLISYRYSKEQGTYSTNAVVDDLRIIRALLDASQAFEKDVYLNQALAYAEKLYAVCAIDGTLRDFYDAKTEETSRKLTLCYADFKTLSMLSEYDDRWRPVLESSLNLVKGGYLGDGFPMFPSDYSYDTKSYSRKTIDTVSMVLTALHLAEIGECPQMTLDFIKRQVRSGELWGSYSADGTPKSKIQSTAIYAIASILGEEMKDEELQQAAIVKMREFRVEDAESPFYGAYANAETQEAFSFDNLYAMLAEMIGEGQSH